MTEKREKLCVVMPVYNEEGAIWAVLKEWDTLLCKNNIDYEIHVYNDGSKDNSLKAISDFAACHPSVLVHDKKNSGHGPTILLGYGENSGAEWIFQVDSDNEMRAAHFLYLWKRRHNNDFIIGSRDGRESPVPRRIISFISRATVRVFYGKGVWDVNSPYRLMRASRFRELFRAIPPDTFAPNVVISGFAAYKKMRIWEVQVPHEQRQTGEVSIKKWKLLKAAVKSFMQTISIRFKISKAW